MNNPKMQLPQSTDILQRCTSAHSYACSYSVRISTAHIHCSEPSEAHTQYIHASSITLIIGLYPIKHLHNLLGTPCAAWVLWNDSQRINLPALHYRVKRTISPHSFKIMTAETCTMQKNDDRRLLHRIVIIWWSIYPKIITT